MQAYATNKPISQRNEIELNDQRLNRQLELIDLLLSEREERINKDSISPLRVTYRSND